MAQHTPGLVREPVGRRVDRLLDQPVYPDLRPGPHRMEQEVRYVRGGELVHHVVVLVDMQNVLWIGQALLLQTGPPPSKGDVMTVDDVGNRTGRPLQQPLKSLDWLVHQIEVVQIDVQSRAHDTRSVVVSARPSRTCVLAVVSVK